MSESAITHLECARCGREHDHSVLQGRCACGGTLLARYDLSSVSIEGPSARPPGMWRYRELLPVAGDPVSLGEPRTPLLFCHRLSERLGVDTFVKDDSPLPGGTFKARGAGVGLTRAAELGARRIVMPSAGNAGGAWSLYAARAGIEITVTVARTAPEANKMEVRTAGGNLVEVEGSIADAGRAAATLADQGGAFLATTFAEPYRLEGKKTAWFETFEQIGEGGLGGVAKLEERSPKVRRAGTSLARESVGGQHGSMDIPRTVVLPVGGGVAAIALAKAAAEVAALGWAAGAPRIVGVQAADCAPIVRAFERGDTEVVPWEGPSTTIAAGLRVPAPAEGALVLETVRASGGAMVAVEEAAIVDAVRELASSEGIFACPEGAAAFAGAKALAAAGDLEGPAVIYNTGAGAKYADLLAAAGA